MQRSHALYVSLFVWIILDGGLLQLISGKQVLQERLHVVGWSQATSFTPKETAVSSAFCVLGRTGKACENGIANEAGCTFSRLGAIIRSWCEAMKSAGKLARSRTVPERNAEW